MTAGHGGGVELGGASWSGLVTVCLLFGACAGGTQPMQPIDSGIARDGAVIDGGTVPDDGPPRDSREVADSSGSTGVVWAKTYGAASGRLAVNAVEAIDEGGGFLVAGALDVDPGAIENLDAFAMRIRADGSVVWQKRYGGSSGDRFEAARRTSDGGFVLAGATGNAGYDDAWVVKVDADGIVSWQKRYGRGPGECANDIVQTDDDGDGQRDDGFVAAGYWNGVAPGAWVLKLDRDGGLLWERYYDNAVSEASAVRQTNDRGYVVSGYRMAPNASPSRSDVFVLRLDAQGASSWYRSYPLSERSRATDLEVASDGGFIVGGFADVLTGSGIRDQAWLLKLAADGAIHWQLSYGAGATGPSDTAAHDVEATGGGYLLGGTTTSDGASSSDYWLLEVDLAGAIVGQHRYGGLGGETALALAATPEGGCLLAGASAGFSASKPAAAWLVSLDPTRAISFDPFTNGRMMTTTAVPAATSAAASALPLQTPSTVDPLPADTSLGSEDLSLSVATQSR